jgi:hypothetical protein
MYLSDIPFCDVFYPTKEEFNNFENYIEKIAAHAKSGIVKVKLFFKKRSFLQKDGKQEQIIIKI